MKNIIFNVNILQNEERRCGMNNITETIGKYVEEKGISISILAEGTNISYNKLYNSLSSKPKKRRKLRGDELIEICEFLEKDPRDFKKSS